MNLLYKTLKPLLFRYDAEKSHELAVRYLKKQNSENYSYSYVSKLGQKMFDQNLANPVGLAAGFDKYAECFHALPELGFGFAELGSFTKIAQQGNPRPRIMRVPREKAVINRMGFNNPGIDTGLDNIRNNQAKAASAFHYAISIGKSKETANEKAIDDYLEMIEKINLGWVNPLYLAVNISSPNTPGLRDLQGEEFLTSLITTCKAASNYPLVVKFAPDFPDLELFRRSVEICAEQQVAAIIVNNTTTDHSLLDKKVDFTGGLSGSPLRSKSRLYLREAYTVVKEHLPIIASGGIMTPEDVFDRILLGASLVQLYTGFIYYGPGLALDACDYLVKKLDEWGLDSLQQLKEQRSSLERRELL